MIFEDFCAISSMCVCFILMLFDDFRLILNAYSAVFRAISLEYQPILWHGLTTKSQRHVAHDDKPWDFFGFRVCNSQTPSHSMRMREDYRVIKT